MQERVHKEKLVVGDISHRDAKLVVPFPRNGITLQYFALIDDKCFKLLSLFVVVGLKAYLA
jgi:hypothetical protein